MTAADRQKLADCKPIVVNVLALLIFLRDPTRYGLVSSYKTADEWWERFWKDTK